MEEVRRAWETSPVHPHVDGAESSVSFAPAPGDRGTEIHVELGRTAPGGKLGEMALKLAGSEPLAKAKDDLRRFKQLVETGEIPRSDATPEGETLESKLSQRPGQPLDASERHEAGVS